MAAEFGAALRAALVAWRIVQDGRSVPAADILQKLREVVQGVASVSADSYHHIFGLDIRELVDDIFQQSVARAAAASAGHGASPKSSSTVWNSS